MRLNRRLIPFLGQQRELASCTNEVLVPYAESQIPSGESGNTGSLVREQIQRSFVGLSGDSRTNDANTPFFRVQAVPPSELAAGQVQPVPPIEPQHPAAPPAGRAVRDPGARPNLNAPAGRHRGVHQLPGAERRAQLRQRLRRDDEALPAQRRVRAPRPPAPASGAEAEPMKRAIGKYWRDFLALLGLFLLAVGIGGYILTQQRLRFPFVEDKPQVIKVELEDAQAVTPGQGQTVRVAGVEIGAIGKVNVEDGVAVVDMEILPEYEGLIRQDATVLLRPKTALKDMLLEVDPGEGKPVPDGGRLPVANTSPDIDPDEIFASLDADARSYLKVLISSGGQGLDGHGEDLRQTLLRLEPLHRDLARLNGAVAGAPREPQEADPRLRRDRAGAGRQGRGAASASCAASNEVFSALAAEESNVSATVNKLPGHAAPDRRRRLAKVETLGDRLGPALNALRPPFRRLDETNAAVRPFVTEAAPIVRDQIRPFTRRRNALRAPASAAPRATPRARCPT